MPSRHWSRLAGVVAMLVVVAAVVATARSTSHHAALRAAVAGTPPNLENEGAQKPDAPDVYEDFKDSSGQPVTGAMLRRAAAQAADISSVPDAGPWQLTGPANIGGRVVDLVVDNQHADTIYVATSGGGIWKSSDAGVTYTPDWPTATTQTMGAIAQGSDGTLYVGTGEANPSGGGLTFVGDGMYKSSDGGAHWTHIGLEDSASIGRVAVDPSNPQVVYAAASGDIRRSVSQRGLYKTTDGGQTWTQVLAPPNATTGAIDVAVDPANPQRVYAALWDHHRNNGARVYGGIGSGLFRSDDGGATWTRLQNVNGVADADQAKTGLTADPSLGRIGVAVAPSDPNRVYVVTGAPFGPSKGTYVSNDGGDSFTPIADAYAANGYQWWFGRVWVDPKDENHVFNADVGLRETTDGGKTWHSSSGVHADQHAMAWDPRVPGRVYEGNDGGTYRSDQNGASTTWIHGTYEPWNQSYHLAVAAQNDDRMATGLQDNGSVRSWTDSADPTDLSQFNPYGGGDGHWVAIDPTNEHVYFACSQNAGCSRYQDHPGATRPDSWRWRYPSGNRFTTDAPIAFDPNNPQVMYVGGMTLLRTTDQGQSGSASWQPISPTDEASSLPGPIPPDEVDLGGEYSNQYGAITAIGIAKTDSNTIYAGTDTGKLWKTSDLGAHWTQMQGVPERWVNAVVVDPSDGNHVYAAFSGYREGDYAANVFETTDGGASWHNVSGNLPNAPVEMITYDAPSHMLFAATGYGVFERKDGDQYWYSLDGGLPNSPVLDVKLSADHKWLYAATFGRSILRMPLSVSVTQGAGTGGGSGGTGGTVPATLSLTLGAPASFGAFTPGVTKTYDASTTANVISTAGDATLSVADPDTAHPGHLVNGSFFLPEPLQVKATKSDTTGTPFNNLGSGLNLLTWSAPVSNDPVQIFFEQKINANDALRTGTYAKTLTFTLSTTNP